MKRALLSLLVVVSCTGCGGGGGGSSPTAPSGPGGAAPAAGTWTGTITRPGGLGILSVRWEAKVDNGPLTGPMTLTNGGTSVTISATGNTAGNDRNGYTIHMSFNSNAGDIPAFPACTIRGNTTGASEGDPFPSPYSSIATPAFSISYSGCRGFIDTGYSGLLSNFIQETVQLGLKK